MQPDITFMLILSGPGFFRENGKKAMAKLPPVFDTSSALRIASMPLIVSIVSTHFEQSYPEQSSRERTHFYRILIYFFVMNSMSSFLVAPMFLRLFLMMNSGMGEIWLWNMTGLVKSLLDHTSCPPLSRM